MILKRQKDLRRKSLERAHDQPILGIHYLDLYVDINATQLLGVCGPSWCAS